jgi:manganese oxidase
MFTVLKVRRDIETGDYADPGWFEHPEGTVAYKVDETGRRTA